jgi:gamma-glutamylcyclotransferase (GGCT)/AIG2-like uncharacterized protein YtfP
MTLYFAYGANLDRDGMRQRCPGARAIGPAVLEGYRFMIGSGGWGSVMPAAGAKVHGVLWRLTIRDRAALDAFELRHSGLYETRMVPVRRGSRRVAAMIYILRRRTPGRARPGYIAQIVAAGRDWGLPESHIREVERWSPARSYRAGARDFGDIT